ncbi:NAD-dependent epimerase/dehydratase family protein [Dasania marina]|uniref:NAD-dependent epimerase/dehydratase family protein n=1 Tax=Dasania marina TaxID=471499 RepID=UPI00036FF277|nr:NAD-dependent epimerase/dehydratase family protein [Dasania marina]
MKVIVVGYNGLVGSAFCRYFSQISPALITVGREQMHAISGAECDLLVLALGNANKGFAGQHPAKDFEASVASVAHYVHAIKAKKTVLISSVDVYSHPGSSDTTKENTVIDPAQQHVYGFHKYLAEQIVLKFSASAMVVRLPGLLGPGLTKNPVFDYFNPNKKLFVSAESKLNFIYTDDIPVHVNRLLNAGFKGVVNVAANNSVRIADLAALGGYPCVYNEGAANNIQCYKINTTLLSQYGQLNTSESAILRYKAMLAEE